MLSLARTSVVLALSAGLAGAAPTQQPFESHPRIVNQIDPLKHLSAISPFFIPTVEPDPLPPKCSVQRVSLLVRHSAILGNDDEFEQTMNPLIMKIKKMQEEDMGRLPEDGQWGFLRDWESPIVEERLEVVSERGKKDAKFLGEYIRKQYNSLFPSKERTSKKHKPKDKTTYKVWTASSTRDIDTAKSYILGSFPSHQSGENGTGDGEVVQLVKVPNKAKDWDRSLTPHKACDSFEKVSSLVPANQWLSVFAPKIRARITPMMPDLAPLLSDQDLFAMQMLCGYESIAVGDSPFCHVFTDEEWLDGEYYHDIRWYHSIGYGSHLSPFLGMPWVKTAAHLLEGKDAEGDDPHATSKGPDGKLPGPGLPPNATHTQYLHPSFTHRESPAFVAIFLNLYNSTSLGHPATEEPPLDRRVADRAWRTSHLISFLGHVALERFGCKDGHEYVRAVVNGKQEVMGGCEDGVDGSCKYKTWVKWIDERVKRWSDWASVCDRP